MAAEVATERIQKKGEERRRQNPRSQHSGRGIEKHFLLRQQHECQVSHERAEAEKMMDLWHI